MRTFLTLALLLLTVFVWAADDALVCPKYPHVWAKISKIEPYGQQLLMSYDKGVNWEQITWFERNGQVVDIQWSTSNWLMISVENIPPDSPTIAQTLRDSLGVFDPTTKIIYWLEGFCLDARAESDCVENVKWVGPDTLDYTFYHFPMSEYKSYQKKPQLTPQFLAKTRLDYAPRAVRFASSILTASKTQGDLKPLLAQVSAKTRPDATKFLAQYREELKYAMVSYITHYPKSADCAVALETNYLPTINPEGISMPGALFDYRSVKGVYEFYVISYD